MKRLGMKNPIFLVKEREGVGGGGGGGEGEGDGRSEKDRDSAIISFKLYKKAGMNVAAGPELCAAVSNAGGLGCIGGVGYTPDFLRRQIRDIKKHLARPDLPFGIDLLLPAVGGNARKTNYDYTEGKLEELIDIIIESGAKLFISAVGVPPV